MPTAPRLPAPGTGFWLTGLWVSVLRRVCCGSCGLGSRFGPQVPCSGVAARACSPAAHETEAQEVKPNGANASKTSLVPDTTNPCGRGWEWTPGTESGIQAPWHLSEPVPGPSWTTALISRVQSLPGEAGTASWIPGWGWEWGYFPALPFFFFFC